VSSSSDHQPPEEPERRGPSTQEIPVVAPGAVPQHQQPAMPLPPHPGASAPAPVPMGEVQRTGPVGFVPGPPGTPATPPVPPPASPDRSSAVPSGGAVWPDTLESELLESGGHGRTEKARRIGPPRNRAAVLGLGLALLALLLLELGLAMDFGTQSYWSAVPLWSAFATLCAALGLVAFAGAFPSGSTDRSRATWRIAAAGLAGLAVFWVLVVLSVVASDRGFLLTAALGALGAALWVGPGRKA
jgi:hypothetical protein